MQPYMYRYIYKYIYIFFFFLSVWADSHTMAISQKLCPFQSNHVYYLPGSGVVVLKRTDWLRLVPSR